MLTLVGTRARCPNPTCADSPKEVGKIVESRSWSQRTGWPKALVLSGPPSYTGTSHLLLN